MRRLLILLITILSCAALGRALDPSMTGPTVTINFIGMVKGLEDDEPRSIIAQRVGVLSLDAGLNQVGGEPHETHTASLQGTTEISVTTDDPAGFGDRYLEIQSLARATVGIPGSVSASNGLGSPVTSGYGFAQSNGVVFLRLPPTASSFSKTLSSSALSSSNGDSTGDCQGDAYLVISARIVTRAVLLQIDTLPNYGVGPNLGQILNTTDFDRGYGRDVFGLYWCQYDMLGSEVGFINPTLRFLEPRHEVSSYLYNSCGPKTLPHMQSLFSGGNDSQKFRFRVDDQYGSEEVTSTVRHRAPIEDSGQFWKEESVVLGTDPLVPQQIRGRYLFSISSAYANPSDQEVEHTFTFDESRSATVGMVSEFGGQVKEVAAAQFTVSKEVTWTTGTTYSTTVRVPARTRVEILMRPLVKLQFPLLLHFGQSGFLGLSQEIVVDKAGWETRLTTTTPL